MRGENDRSAVPVPPPFFTDNWRFLSRGGLAGSVEVLIMGNCRLTFR